MFDCVVVGGFNDGCMVVALTMIVWWHCRGKGKGMGSGFGFSVQLLSRGVDDVYN